MKGGGRFRIGEQHLLLSLEPLLTKSLSAALPLFVCTDVKCQAQEPNSIFLDPYRHCKYEAEEMAVVCSPVHRFH